jgi:hypothetical protein
MSHGKLSVADLAKWFDRPYHTVRSWVQFGNAPRGPRAEGVYRKLERLEHLIKAKRGFPVPDTVDFFARPSYILKIRNGRNASLPQSRSA